MSDKRPFYKRLWFKLLISWIAWVAFVNIFISPEGDVSVFLAVQFLMWIVIILMHTKPFSAEGRKKRNTPDHNIKRFRCYYRYGLSTITNNAQVDLVINDDSLEIVTSQNTFLIKYEQLKGATAIRETALVQKSKSVFGRALVGQMVAGDTGAVIGGMSGIGTKNVKGHFLAIQYVKSNGEDAVIILSPVTFNFTESIAERINNAAGIGTIIL